MSTDLAREFWFKVDLLLDSSDRLSEVLRDFAPSERSRAFFRRSADELHLAAQNLRAALADPEVAPGVQHAAGELKRILARLGASSSKGEVPLGEPALLDQCLDLIYVFQEARYADIVRRLA